jgi:hypothetical protein
MVDLLGSTQVRILPLPLTSTKTSDLLTSVQGMSHVFIRFAARSHPPKPLIYSRPLRSHLTHLSTLLPTETS